MSSYLYSNEWGYDLNSLNYRIFLSDDESKLDKVEKQEWFKSRGE